MITDTTLSIAILPFGEIAPSDLNALVHDLRPHAIEARLLSATPLPERSYDPERAQYRAEPFLERMRMQHAGVPVLGVTNVDLYSGRLNFVFGIAASSGCVALISLHRLRIGADEPTYRARAVKEAVHELGHALGLRHCPDHSCVMHFSNTLADTDHKGADLCQPCQSQYKTLK